MKQRSRTLALLIGLACALLRSSTPASAVDPITAGAVVVAIPLAGHTAKDIVDRAADRASALISQATQSGNLLLANAANQLQVLTANIRYELGNELDKRYEEFSLERRNLLSAVNTIVENANENMDKVVALTDFVALDLTKLLSPLSDVSFYIRRVDGLTVRMREIPYVVKVRGRGVGFQEEGGKGYQLAVEVGGNPLEESAIQTKAQYETDIIIPFNLLNTNFEEDRIASVPVKLTSTIAAPAHWYSPSTWFGPSTKSYSTTFNMVLTPIKAAHLTAEATYEREEWDTQNPQTKDVNGQCNHFLYTQEVPFAKTENVIGVTYKCTAGACGWAYRRGERGGGYEPDYDIQDGNHKVTLWRNCDGDITWFTHTIRYENLVKRSVASGSLEPKESAVGFGETFYFDLPAATKDWKITGKLFTGQQIRAVKGATGEYVEYVTEEEIADGKRRLVMKLRSPFPS